MWPLIVLTDDALHTLPVALAGLSREHVQDNELMMAGSVVTVLPVLLLFLALQRHYMAGLLAGEREGMRARCAAALRAWRCSRSRAGTARTRAARRSVCSTTSRRLAPGASSPPTT